MQPQLFSGARGKISYTYTDSAGNKATDVLAFVTEVSVSVQDGLQPTYVIGQIEPKSIEPLSIDVSCRIGRMIPINTTTGELIENANSIGQHFEFSIDQILTKDSVDITIEDKITGKTLGIVKHARCAGRSTSTSSGDIARESYNFIGIFDGGYGGDSNTATEINYGFETT